MRPHTNEDVTSEYTYHSVAFDGTKAVNHDLKLFTKNDFLQYAVQESSSAVVFVVEGLVCRIGRSTFKHPGGVKVFEDLHARDATEYIEVAHRTDKHVYARLRVACVGKLVDRNCLVPQIDRELRQLKNECEKEGLFDLSNAHGFMRFMEPLLLICVAVFGLQQFQLGWTSFVLASLLGVLGYVRLLWWSHDAQHHALFPDGRTTELAMDIASVVLLGGYTRLAWRVHSIHHAFTNTLDHDWNSEFLQIFEVAPEHEGQFPTQKWKGIGQLMMFYGLVVPAFGILKFVGSLKEAVANGWWWRPLVMVVRMVIVFRFGAVWSTFVLPQVALFFIAFVGLLNHLQMPMVKSAWTPSSQSDSCENVFDSRCSWGPNNDETTGCNEQDEIRRSFTYAMVAPTCSVAQGSKLYGYIAGGLNYHIEHHLFPCMLPGNLVKVSARVRALLDKHGLPYAETSFIHALSSTMMQIFDPSRAVESPVPRTKTPKATATPKTPLQRELHQSRAIPRQMRLKSCRPPNRTNGRWIHAANS